MKHGAFLAFLALGLLQAGCTIRIVQGDPNHPYYPVQPQAAQADPYPNVTRIQLRVNEQNATIRQAFQQGRLDQETAYLLSQNDEMVLRFMREDRAANQGRDLNGSQAMALDSMLNDNAGCINDAIQNRAVWNQYFMNESYDYAGAPNPYVFIIYLDHQARLQQGSVDAGLKAGRLSAAQAQELKERIQAVQASKAGYIRANGRIDLSEAQVGQLSRMAEDNSRYIRYRLKGSQGQWDREKFNNWRRQEPQRLDRNGNGQRGNHWGTSKNWAGARPAPVPTAVPTAIPTAVPAPLPTAVPHAVMPKPQQTAQAQAPGLKLLPPGTLDQFLKRADQGVQQALKEKKLKPEQLASLKKKLAALHQRANELRKQNKGKGVNQDQMTELSGVAKNLDQLMQDGKDAPMPTPQKQDAAPGQDQSAAPAPTQAAASSAPPATTPRKRC